MRYTTLLVLLGAGVLGCRPQAKTTDQDSVGVATTRWVVPPEVTGVVRGLAYRVRHQVRPDTLTSTLALTNPGPNTVRLMFGGCSLDLYLHAADDSLGVSSPLSRSDHQRAATLLPGSAVGCAAYLAGHDVAPGATLEAREFITWSLPDKPPLTTLPAGAYAAVLRLRILEQRGGRAVQDTLVMPAGTFHAR
jgi:hypothetical protein